MEYRSEAGERNPAATWSLISGLLLFVPFLTGILALVLGRMGLRHARVSGASGYARARAGMVLGIVSIALWLALIPVGIAGLNNARHAARTVQCASNLRMMSMGMMAYASGNRGWYPATTPATPICPELAAAAPAATSNYVYIRPTEPMGQIKTPAMVVVAYEPLSNHQNRGMCVLWMDGHVSFEKGAAAQKIIAQAAAQPTTAPSKEE